jgi:FdrA protein
VGGNRNQAHLQHLRTSGYSPLRRWGRTSHRPSPSLGATVRQKVKCLRPTRPLACCRTSRLSRPPASVTGAVMPIWNFIRRSVYHDSLTLMRLTHDLELVADVHRAAAMMGTPTNRALLQEAGLLTAEGDTASANDLIIAVEADAVAAAEAGATAVETALAESRSAPPAGPTVHRPRTLRSAQATLPGANLALISVPGLYAGNEALKALHAGLHVMLFSDNVPVTTEQMLKRLALRRGLFLMGPDCGSAIINGVPLGFANAVPRGRIGLAAASGTGLQEASCLITAAGEGISQAIGVGGRDLSDEVGGLMMIQALSVLSQDPDTDVIVLIGKPPGPLTWTHLQQHIARLGKPCVVCLPGMAPSVGNTHHHAGTLEDAAQAAVALVRGETPGSIEFTSPTADISYLVDQAVRPMHPGQRFVRGLYAGGTLAYEAVSLLQERLEQVTTGVQGGGGGHRVMDLGGDTFTVGRPHPMIDGTIRSAWIRQEAQDPSTAVLLLDVVLGYGAHPDPASEILPAIQEATRQAQTSGRHLAVAASVCGTDRDPQNRAAQVAVLRAHDVVVMPSNAQATRFAALIASRLRS